MWATEEHFFCEAPHANSPNDPFIEPTKIFDNVYALGRAGTTMYAITTSAGMILIDTGYPDEAESVLLDQMKQVEFGPGSSQDDRSRATATRTISAAPLISRNTTARTFT